MSVTQTTTGTQFRWWKIIIIIVVLAIAAWYWLSPSSTSSTTDQRGMMVMRAVTIPVRTIITGQGTLPERLSAVGTVQALNTVAVRSRVEGELEKLYFDDGQLVEMGDLLAQVDARPYQAKLDQAKGQLTQTQAQLQQAKNDLARYVVLEKQQSIAKQQVDNQRALVKQLEGSAVSAKAALDDAQLQLQYTQITAPLGGRLGLRNLDQGNLISVANTEGLVVITQTHPIAVSFSLPESDLQRLLARVAIDPTIEVQVRSRQNQLLSTGLIEAINNQINIDTGTVRVKGVVPNEQNQLFPNQFVSISVLLGEHSGLVIPSAAVQTGSIGDFVYIVDEHKKVQIKKVVVGLTADDQSLITEGLVLGDQVVTEGTDRLRAGSQVEIIPPIAPVSMIPSCRSESCSRSKSQIELASTIAGVYFLEIATV